MRRRRFLQLVCGAATAWPSNVFAQAEPPRRVGVLMAYSEDNAEGQANFQAFRAGLRALGWTDGRNIQLHVRWAKADVGLTQQFAKDLVALHPDLLVASNTPTTAAVLQLTSTIPIVFALTIDPVGSGFVTSLARPGGNVTGFTQMERSISEKWLGLLKEIAPQVRRVAFLYNPITAPYFEFYAQPLQTAARSSGVENITMSVHSLSELESSIAAHAQRPDGGLIVMPDGFTTNNGKEITSLAARHGLPAVYPFRFFAELGGLLSYGNDRLDNYRRSAIYADRILKGAKPGELPVQAPVRFELVINLKTAKTLNLDVPLILEQRADTVIE